MKNINLSGKLRTLVWIITSALRITAEVVGYWFCIMLVYFLVDDVHPLSIAVKVWSMIGSVALFVGFQLLLNWLD